MSKHDDPIVITGGARTPMGSFQGSLSPVTAPKLGGVAIKAAMAQSGVAPQEIDEVLMGCVLPAGIGQAPARQASYAAGLLDETPCTTVNKMCGSGMKTVMQTFDALSAGTNDIAVAGGMESMSNAPYLLPKARGGMRLGHGQVVDHMFLDGLEDAYEPGRLMGAYAEETARKYQFTREAMDDFAITSLKRAKAANEDGSFAAEMVPVSFSTRKGEVTVERDEQPFSARIEKIPLLRPAFAKDGTVTAANSSSISDGAAAVVMMRQSVADKRGAGVRLRILAHASHAQEPAWFTTAPIEAMRKVMAKAGWSVDDVDLFEINEAFAVVSMAGMRDLNIPHEKTNVHGGACALGHPVGASGTRIIVTLMNALEKYDLKRGVASLCIGGGEATAIAVERVS